MKIRTHGHAPENDALKLIHCTHADSHHVWLRLLIASNNYVLLVQQISFLAEKTKAWGGVVQPLQADGIAIGLGAVQQA